MCNFPNVKMTESGTIYHVEYIKFKNYSKFQFALFIPYRRLKAVGITEFQDIEIIHCVQDSERREGELLTGKKTGKLFCCLYSKSVEKLTYLLVGEN